MQALAEATTRIGAAAHLAALDAVDTAVAKASGSENETERFRWVWVVLIGVIIVAAAVAFVYCRARGYRGFSGHIEAVRGPFGIRIGTKIGCY